MEYNGYQQYREQSVSGLSANELLLLLFDELIKRLGRCDLALAQKNYELLDESADRCMAIVRYLDDTLNFDYPISAELHRLYDYFYYELNRVKVGRDKGELDKIKPMLTDLRDTFRQAAQNCANEAAQKQAPAAEQFHSNSSAFAVSVQE